MSTSNDQKNDAVRRLSAEDVRKLRGVLLRAASVIEVQFAMERKEFRKAPSDEDKQFWFEAACGTRQHGQEALEAFEALFGEPMFHLSQPAVWQIPEEDAWKSRQVDGPQTIASAVQTVVLPGAVVAAEPGNRGRR